MNRISGFQRWLVKNRLLMWWLIFIPLTVILVSVYGKQLSPSPDILTNVGLTLQYKIINSAPVIILARVILMVIGVVVIMICLFFPFFRISKTGVEWTRELEEELANAAGEEVSQLIREEASRWSHIYRWQQFRTITLEDPTFLFRELLVTIGEVFSDCKISLTLVDGKKRWVISENAPLNLCWSGPMEMWDEEQTYGLQLVFSPESYLLLQLHTTMPEGFSKVDEQFMLVLGEVFIQEALKRGYSSGELLARCDWNLVTTNQEQV